jgi:hypothetical protein
VSPLALLLLLACRTDPVVQGTAVGNPGSLQATPAHSSGLQLTSARATVQLLELESCSGQIEQSTPPVDLDLLAHDPIELRSGTWCYIRMKLANPLQISGTWSEGGRLDLSLDFAQIEVSNPTGIETDSRSFVLEIGVTDWLSADELGVDPALDRVVNQSSALHDELVASAEDESLLFEDQDEDGVVSESERSAGWVATSSDDDDDDDDTAEEDERR